MAKTSLALPGLYVFGVVNVGADVLTNGITLAQAFPDEAINGEQVTSLIFSSHEDNSTSGVIYIGDLTMGANPTTTAAMTLLGPNVIESIDNQNGLNTIPLGNIKFNASAANLKVRVSAIVG